MLKIKRFFLKTSWSGRENWYTSCRVSREFTPANARKLARACAAAQWGGPVYDLKQVHKSDDLLIFNCHTPGHGGLVVISAKLRPELNMPPEWGTGFPEFGGYVYPLEEDCNFYLARLLLTAEEWAAVADKLGWTPSGDLEECTKKALAYWHDINQNSVL